MKNLQEQMLRTKCLYEGKILKLRKDDILLPNGSKAIREVIEHSGGAAVFAIDEADNVYLTKQYRYPYSEDLIEIPAGKLNLGEAPINCALRELREETGLIAEQIFPIGKFYPSPGYTNEILHVFFADKFSQQSSTPDEDEFLEVITIPFDELLERVMSNKISDAKTVIAVLWYSVWRTKAACQTE